MNPATDKQKWAIVAASKRFFNDPQFKDLGLAWKNLNFYNLPALTKQEASDVLGTLNGGMIEFDAKKIRDFFVKWIG